MEVIHEIVLEKHLKETKGIQFAMEGYTSHMYKVSRPNHNLWFIKEYNFGM